MTVRRFPRSRREAFREWPENCAGIETTAVVKLCAPWWVRWCRICAEFVSVFWKYRQAHSIAYAAKIAWGVAVRGLPF